MSLNIDTKRPQQPASCCVKCQQPHQADQHRVICNHKVSLFANATPVFNQQYGTEELKLQDGWFYVSLHTPIEPVIETLKQGYLPWLCPQCAGYEGASNSSAPEATILDDNGKQVAAPKSAIFNRYREEQQALIA
ncbi:hypothetical protein CWE09_04660 [Aliidiomarina minuta]|uniref:Uncharacterized protein n=1 Tax=Aliidiomarina minuta TaxID=880057 RepID=A0A432W7K9_9GAMM|nr:hypothetical protein [Aliidiomarina minuta]RUO26022.1 hypothetical protein CWE09_04660 [Aliidiomarina minuta]